jgi:hypothetical protein
LVLVVVDQLVWEHRLMVVVVGLVVVEVVVLRPLVVVDLVVEVQS